MVANVPTGFELWMKTETMERHELSAVWPKMSQDEFDELVEDIKIHGLLTPIVLLDDQILDGWHRYQACLFAAQHPHFMAFADIGSAITPAEYVLSCNLRRRHLKLDASQRAMLVVRVNQWRSAGMRTDEVEDNSATVSEMARQGDVSPSTIRRAKVAERAGLGSEVISGDMTVYEASKGPPEDGPDDDTDFDPDFGPDFGPDEEVPGAPEPTRQEIRQAEITMLRAKHAEAVQEISDLENRIKFMEQSNSPVPAIQNERFNAMETVVKALRADNKRLETELRDATTSRQRFISDNKELRERIRDMQSKQQLV